MGCVQSADSRSRKRGVDGGLRRASDRAKVSPLAEDAFAGAKRASDTSPGAKGGLQRANTAVMRQASRFDQLDEQARTAPKLEDVNRVSVGTKSKLLLENFEAKEKQAHEKPELVSVEKKDLRQSKLFHVLQEYEMKDALAKAEPKLDKTFEERERQRVRDASGVFSVAGNK